MDELKIGDAVVKSKRIGDEEYICLNDFSKIIEGARVDNWLARIGTVEYLEAWEQFYNPDGFNFLGFKEVKISTPSNLLNISVKKWRSFGGRALVSRSGRHGGGTWGHIDVALHFAAWLSPDFQLRLNHAFRKLLQERINVSSLVWTFEKIENNAQESQHLIKSLREELGLPTHWNDYLEQKE